MILKMELKMLNIFSSLILSTS